MSQLVIYHHHLVYTRRCHTNVTSTLQPTVYQQKKEETALRA